jgi:hypothetical protein
VEQTGNPWNNNPLWLYAVKTAARLADNLKFFQPDWPVTILVHLGRYITQFAAGNSNPLREQARERLRIAK